MPLELFNVARQKRIRDYYQVSPPSATRSGARLRASTVESPMLGRKAVTRNTSLRRRKAFQIARELSDLVVYCQSEKFNGFKETERIDGSILPNRVRQLNGSLENTPSGSLSSLHSFGRGADPDSYSSIYKCSSLQESEAKHFCRKYAIKMLGHTEHHLVRCYPAGMRIDSSNYNPITMWLGGIQMAALNYQTSDVHLAINSEFFAQYGSCGYVLKPKEMRCTDQVLYKRFNPFKKEIEGLHSTFIELKIISGQYVCQQDFTASCIVEVEVLGIPKDCFKYKTKLSAKNSLNPIWDDTFEIEIRMPELAFLKFTVFDISTNLPTSQRIVPIRQLRQGYRNVPLFTPDNKQLPLSSIFICSVFHKDSSSLVPEMEGPHPNMQKKKRMSFLVVHEVSDNNPYAILKVGSDFTTQEVIKMALEKGGKNKNINEFVLVEEFDDGNPRMIGMEEKPLNVRSRWKNDGRFVLKQVGMDPSWRARLSSHIEKRAENVDNHDVTGVIPEDQVIDEEPGDAKEDKCLICIFNVSPTVAHTMFLVSKGSTVGDIIKLALEKRNEEPARCAEFVLVEEIEIKDTKKKSKKLIHRLMNMDENVYLVQSSWKGSGKLTLTDRASVFLKYKHLEHHPNIRETQSDPVLTPRTARRRYGLVNRVRRLSRSIGFNGFPAPEIDEDVRQVMEREAVSDGDISETEETDEAEAPRVRKQSKAFRAVKIWN